MLRSRPRPLRRIRNLLFDRRFLVCVLILIQLIFIAVMLVRSLRLKWLGDLLTLFSVVTALHLLTRPDKNSFKLSLVFLILLFPVFGGAFYWIFHAQMAPRSFRKKWDRIEQRTIDNLRADPRSLTDAVSAFPSAKKLISYLGANTPYPISAQTQTTYFASGKEMYDRLLIDLANARRYIFLEYFIIEEGEMWNSVLEILRERVAAGVDVRVIYDDLGSILTLPARYDKVLRGMGIRCERFNRFHSLLTCTQNNRDHRKICVVDGCIAYTGGVNLADEYIDKKIKYGRWKDSAVRLCGDAAWSFSVMFLQTWGYLTLKEEDVQIFLPETQDPLLQGIASDGYVLPYADTPMDRENVSENIYRCVIEGACKYLYITTPYLMVDDGMISALKLCAKSGVDVRIITPEVPDKKPVHFTTRSYYATLLEAGVRIYEFSGGFMHAKAVISDDILAIVGTTNLDFRSLYLHFECGACLVGTSSVASVKHDFLQTLSTCREISLQDCKTNLFVSFFRAIGRLFAPLM